MKNKLYLFFKRWNELLVLPIGLLLWAVSPMIIRMADPTAGVFDAGIFQLILFGVIKFMIASGLAWLFLKWSFPALYKVLDTGYEIGMSNETKNYYKTTLICLNHSLILYLSYLALLLWAMSGL